MQTCPDVSSDLASLACHSTISTGAGTTTYLSQRDSRALVMVLAAPSAGQWYRESFQESKMKTCLAHCCFGGYSACFNLRCAVLAILRLHPKSLVILAPVCSGFSFMCSSLAQRFFWRPEGMESLHWVRAGNIMANRVTLLCWLCAALGHTFLLEQPGSARLAALPRWQYFCQKVCWAAQLKHYLFCFGICYGVKDLLLVISFFPLTCALPMPRFSDRRSSCATMAPSPGNPHAFGQTVVISVILIAALWTMNRNLLRNRWQLYMWTLLAKRDALAKRVFWSNHSTLVRNLLENSFVLQHFEYIAYCLGGTLWPGIIFVFGPCC